MRGEEKPETGGIWQDCKQAAPRGANGSGEPEWSLAGERRDRLGFKRSPQGGSNRQPDHQFKSEATAG